MGSSQTGRPSRHLRHWGPGQRAYLFINTPQSKRRASGERPPSSAQCWLNEKTPNLPSFSCKISSFWLLVRTWHPRQRENFAIIRGVYPWKLPHLASASLLTAASEVLSISSSSPAPSALSDVRLYTTPRWVTPSPSMHGHYAHISQH